MPSTKHNYFRQIDIVVLINLTNFSAKVRRNLKGRPILFLCYQLTGGASRPSSV